MYLNNITLTTEVVEVFTDIRFSHFPIVCSKRGLPCLGKATAAELSPTSVYVLVFTSCDATSSILVLRK